MANKRKNLWHYGRSSGFTLIELLVVIAIIALLISIIVPSLGRAKASAKNVVCRSNLKQLYTGLYMYQQDSGRFPMAERRAASINDVPPDGWWYTDPATNEPTAFPPYGGSGFTWFWPQIAGTYLGEYSFDVYRCPGSRCPTPHDTGRQGAPYAGNYGCSRNIMPIPAGQVYAGQPPQPDRRSMKITGIKNPSSVALIFDSGSHVLDHGSAIYPGGFRWYMPGYQLNKKGPFNGYGWHPGYKSDADKGRHPNASINIGWIDGSIENMKSDEFVESGQWKTYWYEK